MNTQVVYLFVIIFFGMLCFLCVSFILVVIVRIRVYKYSAVKTSVFIVFAVVDVVVKFAERKKWHLRSSQFQFYGISKPIRFHENSMTFHSNYIYQCNLLGFFFTEQKFQRIKCISSELKFTFTAFAADAISLFLEYGGLK